MNKLNNLFFLLLLLPITRLNAALPDGLEIHLVSDRLAPEDKAASGSASLVKQSVNKAGELLQEVGNAVFLRKSYPEQWQIACQALAAALRYDANYIDKGLFNKTSCHKEILPNSLTLPVLKNGWQLLIIDNKDSAAIELYYRAEGRSSREAGLKFTPSEKYLAALNDPKILALLSATLRNQLPMSSILKLEPEQTQAHFAKSQIKQRPASYVVYRLDYIEGFWQPLVLGFATKSGETEDGENWTLSLHKGLISEGESLYIHDARGRGADQSLLATELSSTLKTYQMDRVFDLLLGLVNASYVGVRLGFPLNPDSSANSRAKLVSVLLEINDGPMAGARWIWDYTPRVNVVKRGLQEHFGWYRTSFGWSFGLTTIELPGATTQLDFVPQIGLLNVDSRWVIDLGETLGTITRDFKADNLLDLGMELGLSGRVAGFSARVWGSYNSAGFWAPSGKPNMSSQSLRAGINSYISLLREENRWDLDLITFVMAESLRLRAEEATSIDLDDVVVRIPDANYQLFFGGFGFSLRW